MSRSVPNLLGWLTALIASLARARCCDHLLQITRSGGFVSLDAPCPKSTGSQRGTAIAVDSYQLNIAGTGFQFRTTGPTQPAPTVCWPVIQPCQVSTSPITFTEITQDSQPPTQ